jgi:hypothetical protein
MDAPFCSVNEQMEVFRGSAVTREKGWEEEEGTNLLRSADFVWGRPQVHATPARNRRRFRGGFRERSKGDERGACGLLIGVS